MTRHRPGGPIPVPQQIATDPDRVMRRLAVLVAAELRRTGQAVLVPVHRQTLRDRLTPLSRRRRPVRRRAGRRPRRGRPGPHRLAGDVTDRGTQLQQLADDVRELTEEREHSEPRFTWTSKRNRRLTKHVTQQPSLLDQLRELARDPITEDDGSGGSRSIPESRTPEGSAAFELLLTIEAGSAWWVSVAFRHPLRQTVEGNLAALVGCATTAEQEQAGYADTLARIAADVAGWRARAEEVTGWRDRARQPYVRCPVCNRLGTLRVDLTEHRATCLACRTTWSQAEGTIGLLAEHIRAERDQPADAPRKDPA